MKVGNVISREYEILSLMRGCPNVVQILDFFYSVDQKQRIIQNTVMEFCECSLEEKLREATESKRGIPMLVV
jgi:serine/threonine protein kinase